MWSLSAAARVVATQTIFYGALSSSLLFKLASLVFRINSRFEKSVWEFIAAELLGSG